MSNKKTRLWCVKTKMSCNENIWVTAEDCHGTRDGNIVFFNKCGGELAIADGKWSAIIECDPVTRKPLLDIEWCGHGMDKPRCCSDE